MLNNHNGVQYYEEGLWSTTFFFLPTTLLPPIDPFAFHTDCRFCSANIIEVSTFLNVNQLTCTYCASLCHSPLKCLIQKNLEGACCFPLWPIVTAQVRRVHSYIYISKCMITNLPSTLCVLDNRASIFSVCPMLPLCLLLQAWKSNCFKKIPWRVQN